ncbi:MAG TPA: YrdB family protein [Streptosporangiaceae bacterium]
MTAKDDRPAPGLAGAGPGQSVLLTLRFLTELALIVVLALVGVFASLPLAARIVIGVAAPVLAMVIWGRWMAPRARHRLTDPLRLAAELVLFAVAAAALALTGPVLAAVVFAVIAMGVAIALRAVAPGS